MHVLVFVLVFVLNHCSRLSGTRFAQGNVDCQWA